MHGCLEGVFALCQIYMLWSRVTNSKLFKAVGLPPADLLDEVAAEWSAAGHDMNACFEAGPKCQASGYTGTRLLGLIRVVTCARDVSQLREEEARVKLQLFTVQEILNPQPDAAAVVHALLAWIDEGGATKRIETAVQAP